MSLRLRSDPPEAGAAGAAGKVAPAGMAAAAVSASSAAVAVAPAPSVRRGVPESAEAAAVRARIRRAHAARAREQLARARRVAAPEFVGAGADVGPALAVERGLVEVDQAALIPDDPDDSHGKTRRGVRAQRVWAPDRLLRNGTIENHHHAAADAYLTDYERGMEGARDRPLAVIARSGRGAAATRGWPEDRRLFHLSRYREATKLVGQEGAGVLAWCVLRATPGPQFPPTLEAYAKWLGCPVDRVTGMLVVALSALAEFYGLAPRGKDRATIVYDAEYFEGLREAGRRLRERRARARRRPAAGPRRAVPPTPLPGGTGM